MPVARTIELTHAISQLACASRRARRTIGENCKDNRRCTKGRAYVRRESLVPGASTRDSPILAVEYLAVSSVQQYDKDSHMKDADPRIKELTVALHNVEQKLAEREVLINTAFGQTEAARSQYEQANERAEALHRRLAAKEEQLNALQQAIRDRDERIALLEQVCAENDNTLNAINQDIKHQNLANSNERLAAMGVVLEALDEPGAQHRISRVTTTLGRAAGNDIEIRSASASRYHARIVVGADGVYLVDLQSTNGCSINGQRISRQLIREGDVIAIGSAKFRLALGVPFTQGEERSMDETHAMLDDAVIFSPAPKAKRKSTQGETKK
jgi:pSer/pThr/pTyr-binding forkhead associated (FHA) protein